VTVEKLKGADEKPVIASVEKGSLGVAVTDLTSEEKATLNTSVGVKVERVIEDSAAQAAGLRSGDIILKVGGQSIETANKLKSKRGEQSLFVAVHLNS